MKTTTKSTARRVFWGCFFLFAAAVVGLQTFGVINPGLQIGSVVLLILISTVVIASASKLFWVGVFLPSAWGLVLLSQANILPAAISEQTGMVFAIAALVALGFHILVHSRLRGHISGGPNETNFGSSVKYFNEEPLENAKLECNFGSVKAYFNETKLKDKSAVINIECNFGGIELFIPKSWRIEQKIVNSFATAEEKNRPALTDSSPSVELLGECNFGSITITYL
jgi:hypothetical protein